MVLLCALLLFLFPLQQSKPETVALIFGPEPAVEKIVKTSEAESQYAQLKPKADAGILTEQETRLFAALTNALGIIPTTRESAPLLNTRERLDWEIRRGVHLPVQKPDPRREN